MPVPSPRAWAVIHRRATVALRRLRMLSIALIAAVFSTTAQPAEFEPRFLAIRSREQITPVGVKLSQPV